MLHKTFTLLTIDLSMFGDAGAAPAGGEGSAPAAAEAPAAAPEVRYGKQPEQTAAPQQETPNPTPETPPDKNKLFSDLIKGEYKDQYTEATQKLIDRRFKGVNTQLQAQQPIIDMLDQRYGTNGDMAKLQAAIETDRAYWQDAADQAGMSVEQYQTMQRLQRQNDQLRAAQENQQRQWLAQRQYAQWEQEAETMKQKYPDFDLEQATANDMFLYLLKSGNYPMEQAYKAAFAEQIAAKAAAGAEKAVVDNIKARGARPAEAGANPTPAFTVKDDVSKLSDKDVLSILSQISNGGRVTFG